MDRERREPVSTKGAATPTLLEREEILATLRQEVTLLSAKASDLRRFENGYGNLIGSPEFVLRARALFPNDTEIEKVIQEFLLLHDELKRLYTLSYDQSRIFQDKFDVLIRGLLESHRDNFQQTSMYFEKLGVLAVALIGAASGGIMALISHLAPGKPFVGLSEAHIGFLCLLFALATALVGQFSARFQSEKELSRLSNEIGRTQLKQSAFVYLSTDEKRKEEYERLERKYEEDEKRFRLPIYQITQVFASHGGMSLALISTCLIILGLWCILDTFTRYLMLR